MSKRYDVKRMHIGKTPQLDELAHVCGEVYTATLSILAYCSQEGYLVKAETPHALAQFQQTSCSYC